MMQKLDWIEIHVLGLIKQLCQNYVGSHVCEKNFSQETFSEHNKAFTYTYKRYLVNVSVTLLYTNTLKAILIIVLYLHEIMNLTIKICRFIEIGHNKTIKPYCSYNRALVFALIHFVTFPNYLRVLLKNSDCRALPLKIRVLSLCEFSTCHYIRKLLHYEQFQVNVLRKMFQKLIK